MSTDTTIAKNIRMADEKATYNAACKRVLSEKYIVGTVTYGYVIPFRIYKDDMPIGFLIIGFDTDDYWDDAPLRAKGNYNLWRLMIDKNHQNKGHGKEACGSGNI